MQKQLLNDPNTYPTLDEINKILGESHETYLFFLKKLEEDFSDVNLEWRYYNDGKSWLGKATYKKKTFFWLSIWDKFFKVSIFFNAKTITNLKKDLIELADKNVQSGKLIPIIYSINGTNQLATLFDVLEYKKGVI